MIIDKNFSSIMEKCFAGKSFNVDETKALIHGMLDDSISDIRIAAVLTAFRFIPVTVDNIIAILEVCCDVNPKIEPISVSNIVDCGGTGGDNLNTIHISTMSCLVAAAAGAKVAKLSGKSLTSKSGSSSLLKFLNIHPLHQADEIETSLKKIGIVFLEAVRFYPSLKNLSDIRKTLGFKTIIDLIFPLANPLELYGQIVGVYQKDVMPLIIESLQKLGRTKALVVHGEDGQDEISVCGPTHIAKLENNKISYETWIPQDFGLTPFNFKEFQAPHLENSSNILIQVLKNKSTPAIMNAVELNAAAILWSANSCKSIQEGRILVQKAIVSGKALKTFENWKNECF